MERKIFTIVVVAIFLALPVSGAMVRGMISDSATGAPISGVKVTFAELRGEWTIKLDSTVTGTDGSYSFTFTPQGGFGEYYLYAIAQGYYFQTTVIFPNPGIDDTLTKNIKLKKIQTMISAISASPARHNFTTRTIGSRLYLSGISSGAAVALYTVNGRRIFSATVPAGASGVSVPEQIAAKCYLAAIKVNGRLIRGMVVSR